MKLLNDLSNKILSLFVTDAGACVPSNGECCFRRGYYHNCWGNCVRSVGCR